MRWFTWWIPTGNLNFFLYFLSFSLEFFAPKFTLNCWFLCNVTIEFLNKHRFLISDIKNEVISEKEFGFFSNRMSSLKINKIEKMPKTKTDAQNSYRPKTHKMKCSTTATYSNDTFKQRLEITCLLFFCLFSHLFAYALEWPHLVG